MDDYRDEHLPPVPEARPPMLETLDQVADQRLVNARPFEEPSGKPRRVFRVHPALPALEQGQTVFKDK
jgi:hypothetical protein